ncbi:hypothetical protein C8R45DRAFT_1079319 [Mycena sanguinolenta]|nr:hypothetical protein C8R45DRAFT_1079319 [Mycena sanguinolenta]
MKVQAPVPGRCIQSNLAFVKRWSRRNMTERVGAARPFVHPSGFGVKRSGRYVKRRVGIRPAPSTYNARRRKSSSRCGQGKAEPEARNRPASDEASARQPQRHRKRSHSASIATKERKNERKCWDGAGMQSRAEVHLPLAYICIAGARAPNERTRDRTEVDIKVELQVPSVTAVNLTFVKQQHGKSRADRKREQELESRSAQAKRDRIRKVESERKAPVRRRSALLPKQNEWAEGPWPPAEAAWWEVTRVEGRVRESTSRAVTNLKKKTNDVRSVRVVDDWEDDDDDDKEEDNQRVWDRIWTHARSVSLLGGVLPSILEALLNRYLAWYAHATFSSHHQDGKDTNTKEGEEEGGSGATIPNSKMASSDSRCTREARRKAPNISKELQLVRRHLGTMTDVEETSATYSERRFDEIAL